MKKIVLLVFLSMTFMTNAQRLGFSMYGNYEAPYKNSMPMMSPAYGGGFEYMFKPSTKVPLWITGTFSGNYYAYKTIQNTYYLSDTSSTKLDVNYTSAMNKLLFGARYVPELGDFPIVPYLSAQGGLNFMRSRIYVEDPEDGGCKALVNKNVFSRTGAIYTVGGGVQINTKLFGSKPRFGTRFIDIGVYYSGGTKMEYINVNYMKDEPQGPPAHATPTAENERDFYTPFVNLYTNNIHEHKIAEIYKSQYRMWNLRIGYNFVF
jgi:hypothetical protein